MKKKTNRQVEKVSAGFQTTSTPWLILQNKNKNMVNNPNNPEQDYTLNAVACQIPGRSFRRRAKYIANYTNPNT